MHGDEFNDGVVRYAKWLAFIGGSWPRLGAAPEVAGTMGAPTPRLRSLVAIGYLKLKAKTAVNFIGKFEHELIEEARRRGVDGIVCAHPSQPAEVSVASNT